MMKKLNSINSIAQRITMVVALGIFTFATSCTISEVEPNVSIDSSNVEADLVAQADFEEIDDIAANMMILADLGFGGKMNGGNHDDRCGCATVTHDPDTHTITIDFGEGCEGPNGVVRAGKIIITYNGKRFEVGSYWVITFERFKINDRLIEGTRTVTNVSESATSAPRFHIVLEGGKVTWPDGTVATREADRTREWVRADNPWFDEIHILTESITAGVNREQVTYSATVMENLVYKRECRGRHMGRVPVAGLLALTYGDREMTIDFGDGSCDTMITITEGDQSKTIDLSDR